MRAAAVGLLELMRTGGLISMEWRFWEACEDLLAMVRDVKEWRFLVFFLVSQCLGAGALWAAMELPSPASAPGAGGLSHSMSCLAAELNCRVTKIHKISWFARMHWDLFSVGVQSRINESKARLTWSRKFLPPIRFRMSLYSLICRNKGRFV